MHIPNNVRIAGDWGLLPTVIIGVTVGAAYSLLILDRKINFSEKIFGIIKKPSDRKYMVVAVGFCGTLAGCAALIKILPFTQFSSWGLPQFKWSMIETYLNKL